MQIAKWFFVLLCLCAISTTRAQSRPLVLAAGSAYSDPVEAAATRGFSVEVDAIKFVDTPSGTDEDAPDDWVEVAITVSNTIDPELVFDEGFEEAVALFNQAMNGPYLLWNGRHLASIDGTIERSKNALPDPLTLRFFADSISGTLLFRVPSMDPVSEASLLFTHERFGALRVPLVESVDGIGDQAFSDTVTVLENRALSIAVRDVAIDAEGVQVKLSVSGGQPLESVAVEPGTVVPINLSGLRLLIPGESPIAPDFVQKDASEQAYLPIVAIPDRVIDYTLSFSTALAVTATDIGLVMPVAPPDDQFDEPYWIIGLRGERPSLAELEADALAPPASNSQAAEGSVEKADDPLPVLPHAPAWPDNPRAPIVDPRFAEEFAAQRLAQETRDAGESVTPATRDSDAVALALDTVVSSEFTDNKRLHFYRLPQLSENARTNIHVTTDSGSDLNLELLYEDADGRWKRAIQRSSLLGLPQLKLATPYLLSIRDSNANSRYQVGVHSALLNPDDRSFEPSDVPTLPDISTLVRDESSESMQWQGRFDTPRDVDHFRLAVDEPSLATLEITPPARISIHDENGEVGRSTMVDGRALLPDVLLPTGSTRFSVMADGNTAPNDYVIASTWYPLPAPTHELEPNDANALAHRLTPGVARTGRVSTPQDRDWYFFDWPGAARAALALSDKAGTNYRIELRSGDKLYSLTPLDDSLFWVDLPKGHYTLIVSGQTPTQDAYSLELSYAPPVPATEPLSINMSVIAPRSELKSYAEFPQVLTATLTLMNNTSDSRTVNLSAESAHACCRVSIDDTDIELPTGHSKQVSLTVQARRDTGSDAAFPVDLIATANGQRQIVRWMIDFSDDSAPSYAAWPDHPLPPSMIGSWDLARIDFGAYPVTTIECQCSDPVNLRELVVGAGPYALNSNLCATAVHAGVIGANGGVIRAAMAPRQETFDGVEQHGVKSNPNGQSGLSLEVSTSRVNSLETCPKRLELASAGATALLSGLAVNAKLFSGRQLDVRLAAEADISGFVLDSHGTGTRQAREIALSVSTDGLAYKEVSRATLPKSMSPTIVLLPEQVRAAYVRVELLNGYPPFESADEFRLGGLKVLSANDEDPVFADGANLASPHLGYHWVSRERTELIAAFHHARRAEIRSITLRSTLRTAAKATVVASVDGPFGPWTTLGYVQLEPEKSSTLEFDSAVPARYISVRAAEGDQLVNHQDIHINSIRERAGSDTYRSILTEWGHEDSRAGYEWFAIQAPSDVSYLESSADNPQLAEAGNEFDSEVSLRSAREDHYRVAMPADGHSLRLDFSGDPFFRARVEVLKPNGDSLPSVGEAAAGRQTLTIEIPPDDEYDHVLVRVYDSPRHLAVLWDDSGSVAMFVPGVLKMLRNMTFSLDAKWERLQLSPLHQDDEGFLTHDWTAGPYDIAGAIRRYRTSASSKAYRTLDNVLDELSAVDGMRAIVILTDARSDRSNYRHNEIEKKLAAVAPTVFSLHMSAGSELHDEQIDHLQGWARISGGRYVMLREPEQIPGTFAQVQSWLRKPARYRLTVSSVKNEPGFLSVQLPDAGAVNTVASDRAVEVIFDASGSMWKKLDDGTPRIVVARQVLTELVERTLPDATPFALRVFGNREARSCRTDLEMPVATLDRARTLATINRINPQDRSKTAIAASLAAVTEDLASVGGRKVVLLITDGEETCDGDPRASIESLVAAGFDVQINIVGFAIDDDELKEDFRQWAALGGGDYFDADSAEALSQSLTQSLRPRFVVEDSTGAVVGAGRVGESEVELTVGRYRVRVGDKQLADEVVISAGQRTEVLLSN